MYSNGNGKQGFTLTNITYWRFGLHPMVQVYSTAAPPSSLPSILLPCFSPSFLGRHRRGKTPHISLTILTRPWTWSFISVLDRPYHEINIPYWLVPYYYLNTCPPVAPCHSHRDKKLTTLAKSVRREPISKSCEITEADNLNRRRRLSRKAQWFWIEVGRVIKIFLA